MERVWLWATSEPIPGAFRCGTCRILSDDAFSTPLGLMCSDCHKKVAETRMVKMAWDLSTMSASFTWHTIGGGKLTSNGDDEWIAEGQQVDVQDPYWGVAVYQWAIKSGYKGPDPFSRMDYSWCAVPDNLADAEDALAIPA